MAHPKSARLASCLQCGAALAGHRELYCSDACRMRWDTAHRSAHARENDKLRNKRKRDVRSVTLAIPRTHKGAREILGATATAEHDRPRTRAECSGGARPCPFVGCRFHLYLDVLPRSGSIKLNFPDLEPDELDDSCALDVADRGGVTLEATAQAMNLTRERARQLEVLALRRIQRSRAVRLKVFAGGAG